MSKMMLRRMGFDRLPATTTIQFHPVIFAVLDLASILQCLCKEVAKEVVVWGVLEAKVADVAEVFVELLWRMVSIERLVESDTSLTWKTIA